MIEVFKTNVNQPDAAALLISEIYSVFPDYVANFDLQDCDRILRVKSMVGSVKASHVIALLNDSGFLGEVLPDIVPITDIILSECNHILEQVD